ncbi:hypothetical protein CVD28_00730 [Bacillus sp. M6-12]|uniref:hypothetical protein n=1 Tax=Bacillus sp. M6-12 TaxID=2054166 RepID=UPI000C77FE3D|nr:hypothetical protein [Bacillus sp. M6-12]PLS18958.1 hypothetical protein CVD28_00730 [Bacillus sp. M6-12]
MLKCEVCEMESEYLDEVCYYNILGDSISDELDIERNAQNPDALAHTLCGDCAETFKFDR